MHLENPFPGGLHQHPVRRIRGPSDILEFDDVTGAFKTFATIAVKTNHRTLVTLIALFFDKFNPANELKFGGVLPAADWLNANSRQDFLEFFVSRLNLFNMFF